MAKNLSKKSKKVGKLPIRVNRCFRHSRNYFCPNNKIYYKRKGIYEGYVIVPLPILNRYTIPSELIYTYFKKFKLFNHVPVYRRTFINFKKMSKKKLNIKNKSKELRSIRSRSQKL